MQDLASCPFSRNQAQPLAAPFLCTYFAAYDGTRDMTMNMISVGRTEHHYTISGEVAVLFIEVKQAIIPEQIDHYGQVIAESVGTPVTKALLSSSINAYVQHAPSSIRKAGLIYRLLACYAMYLIAYPKHRGPSNPSRAQKALQESQREYTGVRWPIKRPIL